MKHLILMIIAISLSACSEESNRVPSGGDRVIVDQCLRSDLFKQCLSLLPAGPAATKYNDWDEVVSACGNQAYYQALRVQKFVKAECRAGV